MVYNSVFATAHSAGQKGRGHHEAIQTVVENGDAQKYSVWLVNGHELWLASVQFCWVGSSAECAVYTVYTAHSTESSADHSVSKC